jgi:hypothetical protein
MQFPTVRDYAEHSRFALFKPNEYIQHVDRALRQGKGQIEGNYFEDIYQRALREAKRKGKDSITVGTTDRIG